MADFLNEPRYCFHVYPASCQRQHRLGVLEVGSAHPHAYSEEEVRFLALVADQLALAIDAAVNFYLSQQAEERLKLILDLTNQSGLELGLLKELAASHFRERPAGHAVRRRSRYLPEPE